MVNLTTFLCFLLPRRCESMFNVIENLNAVGVWYTYDQIISIGMDWLLCVFHNFRVISTYYLSLLESQVLIPADPGWLQEVSTCSMSFSGIWNPLGPQWQPDTTGVVITPLQQIHRDNRGQPDCWSLMGLGWGCPIDWMWDAKLNPIPW